MAYTFNMIKIKVYKMNLKLIIISMLIILMIISIFMYNVSKAQTGETVELPIIMYHSVLKSRSGDYIVHPSELENDLKYIKENGYETIVMADLINFVYEGTELPQKPIMITFDDGCYNNLGYAVPLLEKYNMKAVISIVGSYTDTYTKSDEANLNYSYLRWKDVKELISGGTIEFQNHTYDLHSNKNGRMGCKKKSWESYEEYESLLSNDLLKLQNEFKQEIGYEPNTFTYPFGAVSNGTTSIIKKLGFKASLSCTSGVNYITRNPESLYLLKRNNRISGISTEKFFNKMLRK